MHDELYIRMAAETDAEALLEIYGPYVRNTAISFEYEVPTVEEFARRIRETLRRYPYLVAVEDGRITGFAYGSTFKPRPAYDRAVEMSVYLRQDCRGRGVGKRLYLALEELLRRQNVLNLNACIAYTAEKDAHLDNVSAAFHTRMGYTKAAHFTKCGYKFGTWYDIIWMEKLLDGHVENPAPFIPITEVRELVPVGA